MTKAEKTKMYMKCKKKELVKMLIQCNETIEWLQGNQQVEDLNIQTFVASK